MSTGTFDPAQYKQIQRRDWTDAAQGWRTWWRTIETSAGVVSERLVELAELRPGNAVLDLATGIGEPALLAARRVGPQGRVVGTDIAPGMIELARERAQEAGVTNVEFMELDAETLDATGEYDAVLSRFGLMFFPDLAGVLERIRHALASGGRLAAAVWGPPERTPFISLAFRVASRELELPPPGPGVPGPFSLADSAVLEAAVAGAGLSDVRSELVAVEQSFDAAEDYTAFMRAIAAPIQSALAERPPQVADALWAAITAEAAAYERDGKIVLPGEVICVTARKAQ